MNTSRRQARTTFTGRASRRAAPWSATLAAALTTALLSGAATPAQAAETAAVDPPGTLVTLPFSNTLFPYPTTGGPGPDSLNALVAEECNGGEPLADQQWFTLPSEGAGLLVTLVQRLRWWGAARTPDDTLVGVAVVDHGTGQVLGCGQEPVRLAEGQQRSVVAWSYASVIEGCPQDECFLERLDVFVNWTSGTPANDRWQDARPISGVPYRSSVDTTLATTDGPGLTPYCAYSYIDPVDAKNVWWQYTPTVSGALPLSAAAEETYGPLGSQSVFSPSVAIGLLTDTGPVALPHDPERDCDNPKFVEVQAGTTYLISLHDYIDGYYDRALVRGGRANLSVGALRPTPPLEVLATPGDQQAVVSWAPPEHAGSTQVIGYRLRQLPDGPTRALPADTRTFTATELTNGQPYAFEVTAINSAGPGNPARTAEVTPSFDEGLPTEPRGIGLFIDSGARSVRLTWTTPASAGSSAITGYRVTRSGTDLTGAGPLSELLPADARRYTFTNLRGATSYTITVRAVNAVGDGRAVERPVFVQATTPTAPHEVTAIAGVRSATVSWQRPLDPGSGLLSEYRVRRFAAGGTTPEATTTVPADILSLTTTGLTAGTEYTFDVAAVNVDGVGEASPRTAPVTPTASPVLPSSPTSVRASQGLTVGTATLEWEPPVSDGGSPVTGYRIARDGRDDGGAGPWSTTVPATARSFTFTHLNVWDTYALTVQAISVAGAGPGTTRSVTLTDSRPSAPTTVGATRGNASATVTWRPPVHAGDGPITGYRIRRYPASGSVVQATATVPGTARTFRATGLTNGTAYRFDVTAVNTTGTGRPSARTAAVTPATVPGAPRIGTATSGATGGAITAKAAWSAPTSTGGSAITGYRVTALRVNAAGDVLATTVSGLRPATARSLSMSLPVRGRYQFTVRAVNALGNGAGSGRSNAVVGR